jgi:hypothetical protein
MSFYLWKEGREGKGEREREREGESVREREREGREERAKDPNREIFPRE